MSRIIELAKKHGYAHSNPPDECRACSECDGHHHFSDAASYSGCEPEHPATKAGLDYWLVCKHCGAWVDYDVLDELHNEQGSVADEPRPLKAMTIGQLRRWLARIEAHDDQEVILEIFTADSDNTVCGLHSVVLEARCAEDDALFLTGHLDTSDLDDEPEAREP